MPYRMASLLTVLALGVMGCTSTPSDRAPRPLTPLAKRLAAEHGPVMYRGDASRTGVLDVAPPRPKALTRVHEVIDEQAPLVLGDWIITAGNNELGLYSMKEGVFRWTKEIGSVSPPAFAEGIIFVNTLEGDVLALDAGNGRTVWSTSTDESFEDRKARLTEGELDRLYSGVFLISSPALASGLVYVANYEGDVLALDQQTGDVDWQYNVKEPVHASLAIERGRVFVATSSGVVVALEAATGDVVWKQAISSQSLGTPVAAGRSVFVAVPKTEVVALNARTGRTSWTTRLRHNYVTLASDGTRVYMTSGGGVNAVLASSGSVLWRWTLNDDCFGVLCAVSLAEGAIFGPSVGRDAVYVATVNEGLRAIDRETGKLLWKFQIPRVGGVSEPVIGPDIILIYGVGKGGAYLAALR